jgi:type IV pilus assembly protein PilB
MAEVAKQSPSQMPALVQRLIAQGTLTAEQAAALPLAGKEGIELYQALVESKVVEEEIYARTNAELLQMPYVDLRGQTVPREILAIIPESTAREHHIIAFNQTERELNVAMADPSDRQIVEFIQKKVDQPVAVSLASYSSVREALSQYRQSLQIELQNILATVGAVQMQQDLSKVAEDLPVVRVTDLLLRHAILQSASDIHIEPTEENVICRYRIDGILYDAMTLPRTMLAGIVARVKVLSHLKIDEHRLPQDGRFKMETEDYRVAFRVSILPVYDGEKVVMRLLDESGRGYDLESLGMQPSMLRTFRAGIQKPHGMILVTGPTGSGKTTTLYAAMKELNTPEVNISTIEDPIEYRMPRINQTQVNPKIGLTFSNGLRSLVRQDPDILMVGEIRDQETASLAVNAALTGHLVLSTLHTNSASGALPRLLDMKVEAFLVASTVNLLVAQRLVRRLCPECRQETAFSPELLKDLVSVVNLDHLLELLQREKVVPAGATWPKIKFYKPTGCTVCSGGYRGRLGIYEVIEFSDTIRDMLSATTSSKDLEDAARKEQSMMLMVEDGFCKVIRGETSIEEVTRVATE